MNARVTTPGNQLVGVLAALTVTGCTSTSSSLKPGGQLEFSGFERAALRDFAVVPEFGEGTHTARDGDNGAVDGFFWRYGEPGWWFKIPNHCVVTVEPDPAAPAPGPSAFTWSESCDPIGVAAQRMRGLPERAGWFPDQGRSGHPAQNPFR